MTTARHNLLVRILARINDQISQSDSLLAGPLTDWEIGNVRDELTTLKVERLEIETQLQNEISYSDALAMAKTRIYSETLERGEYVSESVIEEKIQELAAEIMREHSRVPK